MAKDKKNKKHGKNKKVKKEKKVKNAKVAKKASDKPKKTAAEKVEATPLPLVPLTGGQTYADGTPLDNITYLEAKLILKPDRFTSVDAFRDFGKLVQKVAKRTGVGFIPDPNASRRPRFAKSPSGIHPTFACTTTPSF